MLIEGLITGAIVYACTTQRKLEHNYCGKCGAVAKSYDRRINSAFILTTFVCPHCGRQWTKEYRG